MAGKIKKTADQNWHLKPMRIAALQCNFEKDNLKVIDYWKDFGFNTEQLFHPIADLYSAMYDPQKHEELIKRYIEKAHRSGTKIILYLNVHILGPAVAHKKEEWSVRDSQDGIVMLYENTYPSICLNSPWKEHFFKTLEQVAALGIDGLFLDGPAMGKSGCYCEHCRRLYEKKYNLPRNNQSKNWEFNNWAQENFLNQAYQLWKSNNSGPFYMNLPLLHASRSFVDPTGSLAYNDIVATEGGFMHYGPAKEAFLFKPSFTAKLLEAVAPDKPRVIFMAADHKPWSWWPHTPAETALCIASCAANGANVWYGLHGSTELLKTPAAASARKMFRFLKANEKWYAGTSSLSRVAVLYSYVSDRYHSHSSDESDFTLKESRKEQLRCNMENSARGYSEMLIESGIPFDLITDLGPIKIRDARYDLIILPSCGALSRETEDALEEYVNQGGVLLADGDSSLYDSTGRLQPDFGLSGVLGASFNGQYGKHDNWNYFRLAGDSPLRKEAGTALLPLPLLTLAVDPVGDPVIHAMTLKDMPGRYTLLQQPEFPMVLENTSGRGKCYFIPAAFGEMYHQYHPVEYRKIIAAIVRKNVKNSLELSGAPPTVEMTVRAGKDAMLVHIINYTTGHLRPFEEVAPIKNLRVRLPQSLKAAKVKSLGLNKGLKINKKENSFVLPELGIYDLIVIQ
jgi:hypothetical protein